MGWCSGTDIANPVIDVVFDTVPMDGDRKKIYDVLYEALTMEDWDCVDEVETDDNAWYQMLCEKGIHSPTNYNHNSYICKGCGEMFDF